MRIPRVLLIALPMVAGAASGQSGVVEFRAVDPATSAPIPFRLHVWDADGKPQQAEGFPFFRDHLTADGSVALNLPLGRYTYLAARGPEHAQVRGTLKVGTGAPQAIEMELERLYNLPAEGWWPGDLHVHRPSEDIELLLRAEDIHIAPVLTWWNKRNPWGETPPPADTLVRFDGDRFYDVMGGEDERDGGALLYFHLDKPMDIAWAERLYPSGVRFAKEAQETPGVWIDIEKPFWWDVPIWVAHGVGDSIGLANNHMCRAQMYENEAWGRPRDADRLPPPRGNGFWTQEIYYHLLNAGLRIPPSAGSASGVLPNPVGYNRVYVHTGPELTWDAWWDSLRAGRCFVTNGPMLRVLANGELPGHVFAAPQGETMEVALTAVLDGSDPMPAVEVVQDGVVAKTIPLDGRRGSIDLGTIRFEKSGWFLVRVIADVRETFRFASTGPYYVEIGDSPCTIQRKSVQFFLDWLDERKSKLNLPDATQQSDLSTYHEAAEQFWNTRLDSAQ